MSNTPMKPKTPFKWVFMEIIPATSSKSLTKGTNFDNQLLILDAYYNIPKFYGMENNTTQESMDKLDMLQEIFGKLDEFD